MARDETSYRFFVSKGLTDFQSAGVVGNLLQENSTLDPNLSAREAGGYDAHGIAMWSPARWSALQAWASSLGLDPNALETQLGFIWRELETNASLGLAPLRASLSIEDAALVFEKKFERPAPGSTARRAQLARQVFSKYANRPMPAPPVVAKNEGLGPVVTAGFIVAAGAGIAYALHATKWGQSMRRRLAA